MYVLMIEGTPDKQTDEAVHQLIESLYKSNEIYIKDSGIESGLSNIVLLGDEPVTLLNSTLS